MRRTCRAIDLFKRLAILLDFSVSSALVKEGVTRAVFYPVLAVSQSAITPGYVARKPTGKRMIGALMAASKRMTYL